VAACRAWSHAGRLPPDAGRALHQEGLQRQHLVAVLARMCCQNRGPAGSLAARQRAGDAPLFEARRRGRLVRAAALGHPGLGRRGALA
jgi:hypothetical protein